MFFKDGESHREYSFLDMSPEMDRESRCKREWGRLKIMNLCVCVCVNETTVSSQMIVCSWMRRNIVKSTWWMSLVSSLPEPMMTCSLGHGTLPRYSDRTCTDWNSTFWFNCAVVNLILMTWCHWGGESNTKSFFLGWWLGWKVPRHPATLYKVVEW